MSRSFYCYTHSTPDGEVFYVGKGTGYRAWSEIGGRSDAHKEVVARYGAKNIIIDILPAADEEDALRMERFLITVLFGRKNLVNASDGGNGKRAGNYNHVRWCGKRKKYLVHVRTGDRYSKTFAVAEFSDRGDAERALTFAIDLLTQSE